MISKFADDTKMAGLADNEEHCQRIQKDINRLARCWRTSVSWTRFVDSGPAGEGSGEASPP